MSKTLKRELFYFVLFVLIGLIGLIIHSYLSYMVYEKVILWGIGALPLPNTYGQTWVNFDFLFLEIAFILLIIRYLILGLRWVYLKYLIKSQANN